MTTDPTRTTPDEGEYQYGIDHRRSDIEVTDVEDDPFECEDHVVEEFFGERYGNARIVRRVVGPWQVAVLDDLHNVIGWESRADWADVPEEARS